VRGGAPGLLLLAWWLAGLVAVRGGGDTNFVPKH